MAAFHAEYWVLCIGHLIVLVLQLPDSEQDVAIGTSNNLADFLIKLWPLSGYNVRWPPLLGVEDDGLLKLSMALENDLIQIFTDTGLTIRVAPPK